MHNMNLDTLSQMASLLRPMEHFYEDAASRHANQARPIASQSATAASCAPLHRDLPQLDTKSIDLKKASDNQGSELWSCKSDSLDFTTSSLSTSRSGSSSSTLSTFAPQPSGRLSPQPPPLQQLGVTDEEREFIRRKIRHSFQKQLQLDAANLIELCSSLEEEQLLNYATSRLDYFKRGVKYSAAVDEAVSKIRDRDRDRHRYSSSRIHRTASSDSKSVSSSDSSSSSGSDYVRVSHADKGKRNHHSTDPVLEIRVEDEVGGATGAASACCSGSSGAGSDCAVGAFDRKGFLHKQAVVIFSQVSKKRPNLEPEVDVTDVPAAPLPAPQS